MALPMPFCRAHSAIFGMASSAVMPSKGPLLTTSPAPSYAAGIVAPSRRSPSGWMTTRTSRPYLRANSKSRWSWAGTDMMAPVP